jgi:3'(2'), 5'-bisphosphate nucleotidase
MTTNQRSTSYVDVSQQSLARLVNLARRAGDSIIACEHTAYETKPDGSPVTMADRMAQEIICAALNEWDQFIPIVAEEAPLPDSATRQLWRRYWLVDPLDGTKEYLAGRSDFTVNIALIKDGEPVMGVVGAPALNVMYWAGRGLGAWRQEGNEPATRLQVCPPAPEAGIRIVESRSHPSPQMEDFLRQVKVVQRIQVGSSLKFCWLADGRADCYPRFGPTMAWDVAAGDCVFRNAAPEGKQHQSPLSYNPMDFRQGPFVIGFVPQLIIDSMSPR